MLEGWDKWWDIYRASDSEETKFKVYDHLQIHHVPFSMFISITGLVIYSGA